MINLILITSIIRPPNTPLSYGIRSTYTSEERFEQTKQTIQSIKEKIPGSEIFIIECSELNENETNYFSTNSSYFLNLYDNNELRNRMHSNSKSLGEGTMTICALDFLIQNNVQYDNLIKISGRYYLSENFSINNFNNNNIVLKYIDNNPNNIFTGLYKIPKIYIEDFRIFLKNSFYKMVSCIGYEVLFAEFIRTLPGIKINVNPIGLKGYVSVSNDFYNG